MFFFMMNGFSNLEMHFCFIQQNSLMNYSQHITVISLIKLTRLQLKVFAIKTYNKNLYFGYFY